MIQATPCLIIGLGFSCLMVLLFLSMALELNPLKLLKNVWMKIESVICLIRIPRFSLPAIEIRIPTLIPRLAMAFIVVFLLVSLFRHIEIKECHKDIKQAFLIEKIKNVGELACNCK